VPAVRAQIDTQRGESTLTPRNPVTFQAQSSQAGSPERRLAATCCKEFCRIECNRSAFFVIYRWGNALRPGHGAADGCIGSYPTGQSGWHHFIQPLQGCDGSGASEVSAVLRATPGYYIRCFQPQQRQMLVPVRLRPGRLDGIISFNPFRVATDRAHLPGVARNTADPRL
jgi:hypothetical protein